MRGKNGDDMDLEKIAREYHLAPQADMFIENICQEYELDWVKKNIDFGSKVLELGFGDGVTFRHLSGHCELSVVDGSTLIVSEARRVAQEIGSQSKIHESFFENFEIEEKYDIVFASHVLEHVDNPNLIMDKMRSWLKPDGIAIIIVPNAQSVHRRLAVNMGLQPELDSLSKRDLLVGHQRVYTLSQLISLCDKKNWKVREVRGFFIKPLSNSQMIDFEEILIRALCNISEELSPELCANLALVVTPK